VRYPKMMNSQTGSQPISPRSSNLVEDSDVPAASTVEYNIDEGMVGIDSASRINEGESRLLIKMTLILCSSNIFFLWCF
jgi:hypothetical protein